MIVMRVTFAEQGLCVQLTKFETKSNRVKGLSFHPKRYDISVAILRSVIFAQAIAGTLACHVCNV